MINVAHEIKVTIHTEIRFMEHSKRFIEKDAPLEKGDW
jgi:hypothetical protein